MTLHLIFSESGWLACQPSLGSDDCIVLLGDGVYLSDRLPTAKCLAEDQAARGISTNASLSISYADLVELTVQCSPLVSWD